MGAAEKVEGELKKLTAQNVSLTARCSAATDSARTDRLCAEQLARRLEIAIDENAHLEHEFGRCTSEKQTLIDTLEKHDRLLYGKAQAHHNAAHLLKPAARPTPKKRPVKLAAYQPKRTAHERAAFK